MSLPRTFVGFSSTDIQCYRLMLAWKKHEHIDFDFCDCQLHDAIDSEDEAYIKRLCRARIDMSGTYILLIGSDTRFKRKYVRWETEVAIEKQCRIIGVNLDRWRRVNPETCPVVIRGIGATFVPYSPKIVAHALQHAARHESKDWEFSDGTYTTLGYVLSGNRAERPKKTFPLS